MPTISLRKQELLSAEELRDWVSYDPDTGILTWKKSYFPSRIGKPLGSVSRFGYVVTHVRGNLWQVHRLIWLYVYGRWPTEQIDHINGNRADNRLCNLREATQSQNVANTGPRMGRQFKGATFVSRLGRWQAQIRIGGKNVFLGLFDTPEAAAEAYAKKAVEVHGEFARVSW